MLQRNLSYALACLLFCAIQANELELIQEQAPLPTKEQIITMLSADDFNPRSLQILANTFYWSYEFKKAALSALQASRKNTLFAHNILFLTHGQEFASDDRILKTFNDFHKTWKHAHEMQKAQNACVGILTFKQDINDIANVILTLICTDSLTALKDKQPAILAHAEKLNPLQPQCSQEATHCMTALQDFYTAVDSHDLNTVYTALGSTKKMFQDRIQKHLSTAHAMNDINTSIVTTIETHVAQALFDWYQIIYAIMENRGLLNTQYGMVMCDQHGLIEEEQRTQLLVNPQTLASV